MNRRLLVLCCLVGATGCQSQRNKLIAAGASSAVSIYATATYATWDGQPPVLLTALAVTAGMFGLGALLSGLDHEDDRPPPQVIRTPDHKDEAWEYTKLAAAAARAGDCATVIDHDRIVRELDPEFHELVFVRDAAIARCLADPTRFNVRAE